jgi:hypothetical protein
MRGRAHSLNREYLQAVIKENSILEAETECWIWSLSKFPNGYGQIRILGKPYLVHRVSLWAFGKLDDINDGSIHGRHRMDICSSKACVNPDHLEIGSQYDNFVDAINYKEGVITADNFTKVVCDNGHPFTDENTAYYKGKSGLRRQCKACARERSFNHQRMK